VKRTTYAQQGIDFVLLFHLKFKDEAFDGYRPMLRGPPAESTGGGKQAVQHMVLHPAVPGEPVLTMGQVNVVTKTAKLRTYDCMLELHEQRFKKKTLPVTQSSYLAFFNRLLEFMKKQAMQVEIESRPPPLAASVAPPKPGGSWVAWGWLVLLLAVLAGVLWYLRWSGRLAF
jgi:hypothetical protein